MGINRLLAAEFRKSAPPTAVRIAAAITSRHRCARFDITSDTTDTIVPMSAAIAPVRLPVARRTIAATDKGTAPTTTYLRCRVAIIAATDPVTRAAAIKQVSL
jgi:hypothetical protein